MTVNTGSGVQFPLELSVVAPFSGVDQLLGLTASEAPLWIADNQSNVSVALYVNAVLWKTFQANEAIIIDMNTDKGNDPYMPLPINTRLSCIGTGGTGSFNVSLIYKVN